MRQKVKCPLSLCLGEPDTDYTDLLMFPPFYQTASIQEPLARGSFSPGRWQVPLTMVAFVGLLPLQNEDRERGVKSCHARDVASLFLGLKK